MITVDRDYNHFQVKVHDPGFGRWSKKHLTLEQTLAMVEHYFKANHVHTKPRDCPTCASQDEQN